MARIHDASLLRQPLGETASALQEATVVDRGLAVWRLDGLVIARGETCSF